MSINQDMVPNSPLAAFVAADFELVEDVKVTLRAELDKLTTSLGDLLKLEVGSILQLSRSTGENVDLYAGKVLLACGEILVIDSTLAVRVADFPGKLLKERKDDTL
jgi:flagellar motor switch protein FliN